MLGIGFFIRDKSASDTLLGMEPIKQRRLRTLSGERIVFVGGSNLSYGLDSSEIERQLGHPVVNLGLHAALGFAYQLDAALKYIHNGDVVCLVPEYANFIGDRALGDLELLILVLDIMPEQRNLISWRQWVHLAQFIPDYAPRKLRRVVESLWKRSGPTGKGFNEQGDCVSNWKMQRPMKFPVPDLDKGQEVNNHFIDEVASKVCFMQSRGAHVIMLPPVLQKSTFAKSENLIERIEHALQEKGIPYSCSPREFVLDDEYFSDTPYHLNGRGVPIRTQKVIDIISSCSKD